MSFWPFGGGAKSSVENDVRVALAKLLALVHGKLPSTIETKVRAISDTIIGLLPHLDSASAATDVFVVNRTATDYLPSAVQSYLNLPRGYQMANGQTSDQALSEQLDILAGKLAEVAQAVYKKDSDALLAHGQFLEDKFGRPGQSSLTLPGSSPASPPPPPPQPAPQVDIARPAGPLVTPKLGETPAQAAWDEDDVASTQAWIDQQAKKIVAQRQMQNQMQRKKSASRAKKAWGDDDNS